MPIKKFIKLVFILLVSQSVYGQKLKTLLAEGKKAIEEKGGTINDTK